MVRVSSMAGDPGSRSVDAGDGDDGGDPGGVEALTNASEIWWGGTFHNDASYHGCPRCALGGVLGFSDAGMMTTF